MSGVVATADVYAQALTAAHKGNQVVGEKSDYYVTLEQLMVILQDLQHSQEAA